MVMNRNLAAADDLRQRASDEVNRIRAVSRYTDDHKRAAIARVYAQAHEKMTRLTAESGADDADVKARSNRRAFGSDDLPGDRGSLAISSRDAADRVAGLTTSADAAALLERAEMGSDEVLARAVASHAHRQSTDGLTARDPGWGDVVDTFAATRPAATDAIGTLRSHQTTPSVRVLWAFVLPKPAELSNLDLGAIVNLADTLP